MTKNNRPAPKPGPGLFPKPHEDLMRKIDRVDAYLTDLPDEVQEDEEIGEIGVRRSFSEGEASALEDLRRSLVGSEEGAEGVPDGVGTEFWDRLNRGEAPEPTTLEEAKMVIAFKDQCIERAHERWSDEMDERYRYQALLHQSLGRERDLRRILKAQGDLIEAKDRRIDLYKRIADSRNKAYESARELLELRGLI